MLVAAMAVGKPGLKIYSSIKNKTEALTSFAIAGTCNRLFFF
jgi:hypothetical protein